MDWSRIKTIFIIAFLILDTYLIYEFYKIYDSSQYVYMYDPSFENQLKTEGIKIDADLPKNIKDENYLSASPKEFSKEEIKKISNTILKDQMITITDDVTLESILKKPYKLSENISQNELDSFLQNSIYFGEKYQYWGTDEENLTITFYQKYEDKMLYKNINGELVLYLNQDHEIISYKQTLLENFKELSEKEIILQPIKGIETLYNNGELKYGDKITNVDLGYFTLVHLSSLQVLTPVWRFIVNDQENLFVNAIEGEIIQLNNEEKRIVE